MSEENRAELKEKKMADDEDILYLGTGHQFEEIEKCSTNFKEGKKIKRRDKIN